MPLRGRCRKRPRRSRGGRSGRGATVVVLHFVLPEFGDHRVIDAGEVTIDVRRTGDPDEERRARSRRSASHESAPCRARRPSTASRSGRARDRPAPSPAPHPPSRTRAARSSRSRPRAACGRPTRRSARAQKEEREQAEERTDHDGRDAAWPSTATKGHAQLRRVLRRRKLRSGELESDSSPPLLPNFVSSRPSLLPAAGGDIGRTPDLHPDRAGDIGGTTDSRAASSPLTCVAEAVDGGRPATPPGGPRERACRSACRTRRRACSLERALDELDQGRSAAVELLGEPGIGKTRLLASSAHARSCAGSWCWRGRRRSSSATCRSPCWSTRSTSTSQASSRTGSTSSTRTCSPISGTSSVPVGARDAADVTLQHERYRTTERCERCSSSSRNATARARARRLPLGRLRSVELLGALMRRPPAAPVLMASHSARARARSVCSNARARASCGGADPHRARPAHRDEARALPRRGRRATPVFYEECGGNPFYLEQLARWLDRAATTRRSGISLTGIESPGRRRNTERGARVAVGWRASCSTARRLRAIPSSPSWRPPRPRHPRLRRWTRRRALRSRSRPNTDVPRRFRFRHPLVRRAVYEATPPAGGSRPRALRGCARRRGATAARAHHVERSARQGDLARSPRCARLASTAARLRRQRRTLVRRGAAGASTDRARGGASRASTRPRRRVVGGRPFRRGHETLGAIAIVPG